MKRKILIKINCLMVLLALSQILYSQDRNIKTDVSPLKTGIDKEVKLTFKTITAREMTGSVITIDVQEELKRDQNSSIGEILNGKVPGLFGNYNTWGTGNAVILVDGIRQNDFYVSSLNPLEVASIVILKDALSKAMYGAQGDLGVILITSRRGEAGIHKIRIAGQYGNATPRAMPKYLNAADYMMKYNEAQLNDGIAPSSLRYTQEKIDGTRSGTNPARFPDNDFYSNDYIKDNTTGINIFADVMGGSENVRYYVGTGWNESKGWLNTPQGDITDHLNFRGNLDFTINEYMKMSISTTARLSFNKQPNANNIWATASTELPNNYPVTWDPNLITNVGFREMLLGKAKLANGLLLGGNSSFLNNVYGNFIQNGNKKLMQRDVQFSGKLDIDMRFLTEGLSASLNGGMNFFNTIYSNQNPSFAVYEPVFDETTGLLDTAYVRGTDVAANKYNTNNANSTFFRHDTYYATLNYNRSFGEHAVSATGLAYTDMITNPDVLQKDVLFHTGFSANYMYSKKYIAEMSLMGIGSRKLQEGKRMEMAPAFGLGWVVSEEGFMSDNAVFDYLKIRSSYGISKNDNWTDYNLYRSTFNRGSNFVYQNGVAQNQETNYTSVPNNIRLQKRRDFTFGLDATLMKKAMNLEVEYFNSASLDNITLMSSTYPQILGFENLVYSNYNSNQTQGIELGMNYRFDVSTDFSITAGTNLLYISPKITKQEEPKYVGSDAALLRKGTATDALWALKSNGLYSEADFNPDGSLIPGLPVPTFGVVKAGDIKYLDQNGDNIIDQKDQRIIGHGLRTQYSLYLDLKFKNFEFYILGIGQDGNIDYRTGTYYRVFGDIKYSEMVNDAYGPNNKNVNAIHPRLSTTTSSNNNRNSDYWMYKNNSFIVPTMQLTYHFSGKNKLSFLKDSRVYVRANNALVLGENKKYSELNVGSAPKTRNIAVGFVTSF
jgi:TonB-linked SusC/RagA family outer membrane protein